MYEGIDFYEEIRSLYPLWLRGFLEFDAIFSAGAGMLEECAAGIRRFADNQFVMKCDEETLRELEEFLGIAYDYARGDIERRRLIVSHFVGNGRFGVREIREIVAVFTNSPCNVRYENGMISVVITRDINDTFILSDCISILRKRKPAHLGLEVMLSSPFNVGAFAGVNFSEYIEEKI